jgi:hypothetical protein
MQGPNLFMRLLWVWVVFVRFLFDRAYAGRAMLARAPGTRVLLPGEEPAPPLAPAPVVQALPVSIQPTPEPKAPPKAEPKPAADGGAALHLLAILQREGRFVDFLQEDISSFADEDVGGAARVVHDGCRKALAEYLSVEPLRTEGEGARITVEKGFDPSAIRLTGNVTGEPPFNGALRHHGWRVAEVKLPPPPAGQDLSVIAPAEVEL